MNVVVDVRCQIVDCLKKHVSLFQILYHLLLHIFRCELSTYVTENIWIILTFPRHIDEFHMFNKIQCADLTILL